MLYIGYKKQVFYIICCIKSYQLSEVVTPFAAPPPLSYCLCDWRSFTHLDHITLGNITFKR